MSDINPIPKVIGPITNFTVHLITWELFELKQFYWVEYGYPGEIKDVNQSSDVAQNWWLSWAKTRFIQYMGDLDLIPKVTGTLMGI